jgi:hypothetical protein
MRSFFSQLKIVAATVAIIGGISLLAILAIPTTVYIGDGGFYLTVRLNSASGSKLAEAECYGYPTFAEAKAIEAQAFVEQALRLGCVRKDDALEVSVPLTTRGTKHPFRPSTTRDSYRRGLLLVGKLESGRRVRIAVEVTYREGNNSIEVAIP